jgi:hypothetical protein
MSAHEYDKWTISRWRLQPRIRGLEFEDLSSGEQAPPLWKDLTLASIVAVLIWAVAAAVVG